MISPDLEQKMRAALAQVEGDADKAEAAVPGLVSSAWAWVMDAESTAAGVREVARKARQDADRFRERFNALVSSATATDAEGERFIADATRAYAGGQAGKIAEEAGDLLKPSTAVSETAKGTIADIKKAAPWVGGGLGIVVAAAAVLLVRDAVRAKGAR